MRSYQGLFAYLVYQGGGMLLLWGCFLDGYVKYIERTNETFHLACQFNISPFCCEIKTEHRHWQELVVRLHLDWICRCGKMVVPLIDNNKAWASPTVPHKVKAKSKTHRQIRQKNKTKPKNKTVCKRSCLPAFTPNQANQITPDTGSWYAPPCV